MSKMLSYLAFAMAFLSTELTLLLFSDEFGIKTGFPMLRCNFAERLRSGLWAGSTLGAA